MNQTGFGESLYPLYSAIKTVDPRKKDHKKWLSVVCPIKRLITLQMLPLIPSTELCLNTVFSTPWNHAPNTERKEVIQSYCWLLLVAAWSWIIIPIRPTCLDSWSFTPNVLASGETAQWKPSYGWLMVVHYAYEHLMKLNEHQVNLGFKPELICTSPLNVPAGLVPIWSQLVSQIQYVFNWRLLSHCRPYSVSEVLLCRHQTSFGLCLLRVLFCPNISLYLNRKWNWRNFSVLRKWTVLTKDDLFVFNIFPLTAVNWHASEGIIFLSRRNASNFYHIGDTLNCPKSPHRIK